MTLAGTPAARLSAGTSEVTTEPSAITLPSPMVTPGKMALVQIQTSSPMLTGLISDGAAAAELSPLTIERMARRIEDRHARGDQRPRADAHPLATMKLQLWLM